MAETSRVTQAIGQTENLLRSLLRQTIGGLTFEEWVALNVLASAGRLAREQAVQRIAAAAHVEAASVENAIDGLIARQFVSTVEPLNLELSQAGRDELQRLRPRVGEATKHLLDDLSPADTETLVTCLASIRARAEEALARR